MGNIQTFLKKSIQVIFVICIVLMIVYNMLALTKGFSIVMVSMLAIIVVAAILFILYKKKIIGKKILLTLVLLVLLMGIGYRIYLIETTNFDVKSDFELFFDAARNDAGYISDDSNDYYLSYNGYVYNYAKVLSPVIKIFGDSPQVALYFNIVLQLITVFLIYKTLRIKLNKIVSLLGGVIWFVMPTVIFSTLLISSETLFMPLFMLSVYLMLKLLNSKLSMGNECILYAILGIACSLANGIRPVMAVFIIALIIIYLLSITKFKKIIPLAICIVVYIGMNKLITMYDSHGLKGLRSGAMGWSIYYGSNYDYKGFWNAADGSFIFPFLETTDDGDKELTKLALERYKSYGILKTADLFNEKFKGLWTENNGTYPFVVEMVTKEDWANKFKDKGVNLNLVGTVFVMFLLIGSLIVSIRDIRKSNYSNLFLQLFIIGYVLSNLIVVYSGRYNFPAYPIFIIIALQCFTIFRKQNVFNKNKISKIEDPSILAIVPAYNESESILKVCNDLKKSGLKQLDYIIINDGSKDNTKDICERNNLNCITLTQNLGIGGSVQTGYKYAYEKGYDIAIQFDGDGQHNAKYIKNIIEPIIKGEANYVIGSRFIGNVSKFKSTAMRQFGSKILSNIIEVCTGVKVTDPTSGFRAVNKEIIGEFVKYYPVDYPEPETIVSMVNKGFSIKEVPVDMNKRETGKSSITPFKSAYYMLSVSLSIILTNFKKGDK